MDRRFEQLKSRYQFHNKVAELLGVNRRTYLNYRKGKMPKRASVMIDLLLENGNGTSDQANDAG